MFYDSYDNKFTKILKQLVFWLSLSSMTALFFYLITADTALPQRQITLEIDLKNKINICSPDENSRLIEKKFYEF